MKKIKLCFLISIVFLLAGCDAEINITIDDNLVEQYAKIKYDNGETNGMDAFDYFGKRFVQVEDGAEMLHSHDFYSIDMNNMTGNVVIPLSDYVDPIFVTCFDSYVADYSSYDNTFKLTTSSGVTCFDDYSELDNVKVIVSTNYKIISHNADYVDNNKLVWEVNRSNYNSFNVELDLVLEKTNYDLYYIAIAGTIVVIIIGLVTLKIYSNYKKNNKI